MVSYTTADLIGVGVRQAKCSHGSTAYTLAVRTATYRLVRQQLGDAAAHLDNRAQPRAQLHAYDRAEIPDANSKNWQANP
jgi:hypothetical protein